MATNETRLPELVLNETRTGLLTLLVALNVTLFLLLGISDYIYGGRA